ncbi:hypothetical protein VCSRO97_3343 [Vibrio cholerae]|nr:hypothetical protein VCSRO97_3343 [Vibrio cholerae]
MNNKWYGYIKPDAVEGDYASISKNIALDLVLGLSKSIQEPNRALECRYNHPRSRPSFERAIYENIEECGDEYWLEINYSDPVLIESNLAALNRYLKDKFEGSCIPFIELYKYILNCFQITNCTFIEYEISHNDFFHLYKDNRFFILKHEELKNYLVDKKVVLYVVEGIQAEASVHLLKEYIRRVLKFHDTDYDAVENLYHVADPYSYDREYIKRLINTVAP